MSIEHLTREEMALLSEFRQRQQLQSSLTQEEKDLLHNSSAPRRYGLQDLDPECWSKLSQAERAECQRQVAEAVAAAQRGE